MTESTESGCALSGLGARYVAGTLPAAEAEAFEEHFFACEACWQEVEQARALRAAFVADLEGADPLATSSALEGRTQSGSRWGRRGGLWPAGLAAAAVLLLLLGVPLARRATRGGDTERGGAPLVELAVDAPAGVARVTWHPVAGAAIYQVRLFDSLGVVVLDRLVADTSFSLDPAPASVGTGHPYYWQVVALDEARRLLASSRLRAAAMGAGARPPRSP